LSAEDFGGLVSAGLGRNSLFSTLEHDYGIELAHADEEVGARRGRQTAELCAVPRAVPCRASQVIYST
jgi:hypothetical protein